MFEVDQVKDSEYTARPEYPVKAYRTPQEGCYKINHYHVYNVDAADSRSMTEGHIEGRKQVLDAYRVLHDKTPGFEHARITRTPSVLGTRESRHICGKYMITVEDVHHGVKYEDRIAAFAFGMDVHTRTSETPHGNFKVEIADVYYVPYRSLIPLGCKNLLVAGKTISCQSQAAGGLRVMPCAMAIGQAAGAAAAIALKENAAPDQISTDLLRETLLAHGAILD